MKRIYLVPNIKKDKDLSVTNGVASTLCDLSCDVFVSQAYRGSLLNKVNYVEEPPCDTELVIVIGGDGSFIDAAPVAIRLDVPILGVNLGKVGYLSELEPSDIASLSRLISGDYKINERMLLEATHVENTTGRATRAERLAVNDAVLSHPNYLGISEFILYSNEGGIKYRADGIVVATPAGSTAYSLSSGGPIVSHDANAVIVTPIAPHSFFNRSIVFGENDEIGIKNTSEDDLKFSIDGRYFTNLAPGDKCKIKVSPTALKVLTFKNNNMFSNLFSKMKTVEDII